MVLRPRADRTESGVIREESGNTDKISDSKAERRSVEAGGWVIRLHVEKEKERKKEIEHSICLLPFL